MYVAYEPETSYYEEGRNEDCLNLFILKAPSFFALGHSSKGTLLQDDISYIS